MADLMKKCSKCGEEKPATTEYFYAHNEGMMGLRPDCKQCHNTRSRQYAATHRDDIRAWRKRYRAQHGDKIKAGNKNYYERNKAKINAKQTEYNRRNSQAYLARMREWRRNNPHKVQVWIRNRRAKLKNCNGSHSIDDVMALLSDQGGLCIYCKTDISDSFQVDHIIPVSKGGDNDKSNLQLLCKTCNLLKRDKHPDDFARERELAA